MVFTTRDLSLGGDLGIERKLEMQPLTENQMRDFIRAYIPDQSDTVLQKFSFRLKEFSRTPLVLWMLCEALQRLPDHRIPSNLAEVFRAFTTMYEISSIRKHEVSSLKGDVRPLSDRRIWKSALKSIAFAMMHGESRTGFRLTIKRNEAEKELCSTFKGSDFLVRDILDDLLRYHLVQKTRDERIEFRHQVLQEYYAAEALLDYLPTLTDTQLKKDYINYLKWTEPIALMLSLLNDDKAQAFRIVKLAINEVDVLLGSRFAGQVYPPWQYTTVGWIDELSLPSSLKYRCYRASRSEQSVPKLLDALEHEKSSVVVDAVIDVLGENASDAAIPGLLKLMKQDSMCFRIVQVLGKMGSNKAVEELIRLSNLYRHRSVDIFDSLMYALLETRNSCAVPELIWTLRAYEDFDTQSMIASGLGEFRDERIVPVLIETFLGHTDGYISSGALSGIAKQDRRYC